LRELSDVLFRRILPGLRTRRLVVVPHGCLHAVPFQALPLGDGWLCERFDIRYVPSGGVYAMCARDQIARGDHSSVFAVPDARAPAITNEAVAVLEQIPVPTSAFVGDAATYGRLQEHASSSQFLHIASHAVFRPHQPMVSSIRLADHWMNLYDIYGLDIAAELVVLSACETGCAHVSGSDDALGLVRGFLYAGARRLLVSRWRVHDESAAIFMQTFYRECKESRDFEAAYRVAMNEVRTQRPHPYFWAPFFLVGFPARTEGVRGRDTTNTAETVL
jgi:CHAT domain-containing protein